MGSARVGGSLRGVAKHLVDIDDDTLASAQIELGTSSMSDTVNEALRRAAVGRAGRVDRALDRLARRQYPPRGDAWCSPT